MVCMPMDPTSAPKVKVKGHQAWVIGTTHRCLLSKARASKGKNWLLVTYFLSWKEVILRQDVPETFTKQTNFLPRCRTFKKEKKTLPRPTAEKILDGVLLYSIPPMVCMPMDP